MTLKFESLEKRDLLTTFAPLAEPFVHTAQSIGDFNQDGFDDMGIVATEFDLIETWQDNDGTIGTQTKYAQHWQIYLGSPNGLTEQFIEHESDTLPILTYENLPDDEWFMELFPRGGFFQPAPEPGTVYVHTPQPDALGETQGMVSYASLWTFGERGTEVQPWDSPPANNWDPSDPSTRPILAPPPFFGPEVDVQDGSDFNGDGCQDSYSLEAGTVDLCFLAGDVTGDFAVTFADFLVLSQNLGHVDQAGDEPIGRRGGDLNLDGRISFEDFLILEHNFGKRIDPVSGVSIRKIA